MKLKLLIFTQQKTAVFWSLHTDFLYLLSDNR